MDVFQTKLDVLDKHPKPVIGRRYVAGITTPSNGFDAYTIAILDTELRQIVSFTTIDNDKFEYVFATSKRVLSFWDVALAWCEQHGFSSYYIEYMQIQGSPISSYKMNSRSKIGLVEQFARGIDKGLSTVYHAGLFKQLDNYRIVYKGTTTGNDYQYIGEDNFIIAAALAHYGLSGGFRVNFA